MIPKVFNKKSLFFHLMSLTPARCVIFSLIVRSTKPIPTHLFHKLMHLFCKLMHLFHKLMHFTSNQKGLLNCH